LRKQEIMTLKLVHSCTYCDRAATFVEDRDPMRCQVCNMPICDEHASVNDESGCICDVCHGDPDDMTPDAGEILEHPAN
jgi:hypothetical protein